MKYINYFKRDKFDLDVNQYVKIRNSSPFYELAKDRIFKIDRKDKICFYLKDMYGNYPDITFSEISKPNVRQLTSEEHKELEILLSTNKYNL